MISESTIYHMTLTCDAIPPAGLHCDIEQEFAVAFMGNADEAKNLDSGRTGEFTFRNGATERMTEANKTHAAALRQVAEIYENAEADLNQLNLFIHTYDKDALINTLKLIGGKFTKRYDDTWLRMESQKVPGLTVVIWRDTVCRKTVTYDCEPLLSPEDELEVEAASA